ncbi:MAG TPA: Mov34/MPN/PAD-1 family protein [Actinospica sp.]|nr:Mov34/MPN/PAD-1 family protein [Actinospica sp.]
MLTIRRAVLDSVLDHAYSGLPDISCGLVAGPEGSDRPERHIPMRNAEPSRTFWAFDPVERWRVRAEMDERGEEPVVIYYSQGLPHARISSATVAYAVEPQVHYLVISASHPETPLFRSFTVVDGRAVEDRISILEERAVEDEINDSTP